ncbi:MAG TPA: hypothetical protein VNO30_35465 [Kofleriaceae bacterium]|nr:hypothetical protein [Kofleriaceae bacterium]
MRSSWPQVGGEAGFIKRQRSSRSSSFGVDDTKKDDDGDKQPTGEGGEGKDHIKKPVGPVGSEATSRDSAALSVAGERSPRRASAGSDPPCGPVGPSAVTASTMQRTCTPSKSGSRSAT